MEPDNPLDRSTDFARLDWALWLGMVIGGLVWLATEIKWTAIFMIIPAVWGFWFHTFAKRSRTTAAVTFVLLTIGTVVLVVFV